MNYLLIIALLMYPCIQAVGQNTKQEISISEARPVSPGTKKEVDKEQLKAVITGVHVVVFSKNILLTERITRNESDQWNQVLKEVEAFVQKNDPSLNSYYMTLLDASNAIINTLKTSFNAYIAPALKNPADKDAGTSNVSKIDLTQVPLQALEEQVNKLKAYKESLKKVQTQLKPSKLGLFPSKKGKASNAAKEVLNHLAFILEVTCDKIFTDLKKLTAPTKKL